MVSFKINITFSSTQEEYFKDFSKKINTIVRSVYVKNMKQVKKVFSIFIITFGVLCCPPSASWVFYYFQLLSIHFCQGHGSTKLQQFLNFSMNKNQPQTCLRMQFHRLLSIEFVIQCWGQGTRACIFNYSDAGNRETQL